MGDMARVLFIEDQPIVRAALKLLLESEPDLAMEISIEAILHEARRRRLRQPAWCCRRTPSST